MVDRCPECSEVYWWSDTCNGVEVGAALHDFWAQVAIAALIQVYGRGACEDIWITPHPKDVVAWLKDERLYP